MPEKWTDEDEAGLKGLLAKYRRCHPSKKDTRFDIQLAQGKLRESLVKAVGEDTRMEVKTDFGVSNTGNIFVEVECRGKLSGLYTTKSPFYAFVLEGEDYSGEVIVLIKTQRLKRIIETGFFRERNARNEKKIPNVGYLIPLAGFRGLLMPEYQLKRLEAIYGATSTAKRRDADSPRYLRGYARQGNGKETQAPKKDQPSQHGMPRHQKHARVKRKR